MVGDTWYRMRVQSYAGLDEWENVYTTYPTVVWEVYTVVKETPKGVWLKDWLNPCKKFVLRDAKKRFACPTKKEAQESFIHRKNRHIAILSNQLANAERELLIGKNWAEKDVASPELEGWLL